MNFRPMQYQSILKRYPIRLALALAGGFFFKFISDVVFGLMYRNYDVFQGIGQYLLVIIPAIATVELFWFTTQKLDYKISYVKSPLRRFVVQGAFYSGIIFFIFIVIRWLIIGFFMPQSIIVVANEVVLIIVVLFVALLFNLIDLGIFLLFKWRYSLSELERFKKENAEYRFEMLRSQINPHFLFNSLNTLSSLIHEDVETATAFTRQLSQVYRYVLENRQKDLIELNTELKFIESYRFLLELRFKDRLKIDIQIDDTFHACYVAPMTIQLLVENAVKHNVITQNRPLKIAIFCQNNYLVVSNNLQPKPPEGGSTGFGLRNITLRYELLTDRQVIIDQQADSFTVKVPLLTQDPNLV